MTTNSPDELNKLYTRREEIIGEVAALYDKYKRGSASYQETEQLSSARQEYNRLSFEIDTHWNNFVPRQKPSFIKRIFRIK